MSNLPPIPDPLAPQKRVSWFASLCILCAKATKFGRDWHGAFHILAFVIIGFAIATLLLMNEAAGVKLPDGSVVQPTLGYAPISIFLLILAAYCLLRGVWLFLGGIWAAMTPSSSSQRDQTKNQSDEDW